MRFLLNISVCTLAVCLLLHTVSSEEDHEHNHEHSHEDPFEVIVELTSEEPHEFLSGNGLQKVLSGMQERLPASAQCFTFANLGSALHKQYNQTSSIDEEHFHDIATILIYFATEESCIVQDVATAEAKLWNSNVTDDEEQIENLVESLRSVDYEPLAEEDSCFNGHSLHDEPVEPKEIFAKLVLFLFEGQCILPESEYFQEELLEYLNATGGQISKEAFENFVHKIGIGKIDSENHEEEDHNEENHEDDHSGHDHRRRKRESEDDHDHEHETGSRCYTVEEILSIYETSDNIRLQDLQDMCPALMHQLASGACNPPDEHDDHDDHNDTAGNDNLAAYTTAMIYGYGTASVAVISLLALGGIIFFPFLETNRYKMCMQFLVALGVGALAADALLHIIPYTLGIHVHGAEDDGHNHSEEEPEDYTYVWRMLVVCGGIYIFFLFEGSMNLWRQRRQANASENGPETYENTVHPGHHDHSHQHTVTSFAMNINENSHETKDRGNDEKTSISSADDMLDPSQEIFLGLNSVCIMVLIGDILHNFGDGIAIGVAFSSSWTQGLGTSLAVFCHELPHEFGDFAIYLKKGATKWKAIMMNFIAACFAFIGLYLGISFAQDEAVRQWLMAAIAGMFLYISLVEVLHELVIERTDSPVLQFVLQNLGLLTGFAILVVIAIFEEDLESSISG